MVARLLCSLAVVFVVACSAPTPDEPVGSTSEALGGHCRIVCPKCHPNEICPLYACIQDCTGGKPATCVETQLCPIGYAWDSNACSCVPAP